MFPTVAGAAGMNIHGKNNFKVGTFGDNVPNKTSCWRVAAHVTCSREQHADRLPRGDRGFGMLGIITRVKTRTTRIHSGDVKVKGISCHDLGEMMYMDAHTGVATSWAGWTPSRATSPSVVA